MAGCVLVVSLLFSPGMLPAERPSHLYRKRMPLCLGCSMISRKGLAAQRRQERKSAVRTSSRFPGNTRDRCVSYLHPASSGSTRTRLRTTETEPVSRRSRRRQRTNTVHRGQRSSTMRRVDPSGRFMKLHTAGGNNTVKIKAPTPLLKCPFSLCTDVDNDNIHHPSVPAPQAVVISGSVQLLQTVPSSCKHRDKPEKCTFRSFTCGPGGGGRTLASS